MAGLPERAEMLSNEGTLSSTNRSKKAEKIAEQVESG